MMTITYVIGIIAVFATLAICMIYAIIAEIKDDYKLFRSRREYTKEPLVENGKVIGIIYIKKESV